MGDYLGEKLPHVLHLPEPIRRARSPPNHSAERLLHGIGRSEHGWSIKVKAEKTSTL